MSLTDDPWLWPPQLDVPPVRSAAPIRVYRWHAPVDGGNGRFDKLDNVNCLEIVSKLAPDPGHCVLEYRFGTGDPAAPADAMEALNSAIRKPKTIEVNDRIVVKATQPDGKTVACIFDGYALAWSVVMDQARELVRITCVGVAKRLSDTPVHGALYRQGHLPESIDPADQVKTDNPAHFNPKGVGNCPLVGRINVPSDDPTGGHYPFIDATNTILRGPGGGTQGTRPGPWTLPETARYLCFYENKDEKYVQNPRGKDLDSTLTAFVPLPDLTPPILDGPPYDPAKPETYVTQDIPAPDLPVDGKPWDGALHGLIAPHGFALSWDLTTTGRGEPRTALSVFHPQRRKARDLRLQARGSAYDAALTNLGNAEITRDLTAAVNRWEVHGARREYEASFVLAQNFGALSEHASAISNFDSNSNVFNDDRASYREFILDESGESHYLPGSSEEITGSPANLDDLFGAPLPTAKPGGRPTPQYVARRRPPIGDLITTDRGVLDVEDGGSDPVGRRLKWELAISADYATDASARFSTLTSTTPTGGTWSIALDTGDGTGPQTTAPIAWNAEATTVQTAVEALPNVGTGNAVATGGAFPANDLIVRLAGDLAGTPVTSWSVNSSLTGAPGATPAVTLAATTAGKDSQVPGLWDGSGTWQAVTTSGWALMKDRVGVRYTGHNPNMLNIGKSAESGVPFPSGKVNLVECLATPDDPSSEKHGHPKVWFRLTCVIQDDKRLKATVGATSDQRLGSPLGDTIVTRIVDAHDRYKRQTVYAPSAHNPDQRDNDNTNPNGHDWRDDTLPAQSEATQMQVTTLNGLLAGPVMLPRFTRYYLPGDRIGSINGRSIYFRGDDGTGKAAAPWLPVVTEVRWQFSATGQRTLISLSDADQGRSTVMRGRGIYHRRGPHVGPILSLGNTTAGPSHPGPPKP